jgi:hypothetical protein
VSGKYGFVDTFGKYAKLILGVRPAFILDLSAVIFSYVDVKDILVMFI